MSESDQPQGNNTDTNSPNTPNDMPSPNNNEEMDWELQVAEAYQQAQAAPPIDGGDVVQAEMASIVDDLKNVNQSLAAQIEGLKLQLEDTNGQYRRLAADFENFRKRTQKEKEEQEQQIKATVILELLPMIDNFERARAQLKPQNEGEMNIHKSYQSVYKQMVDGLKKLGVSPMRPEGQEFDPNFHDAVMREHTDQYPEGTVTEELVRGYTLGERVLRHAMVKVAVALEETTSSENSESN
ncbi:MAG: nucleotide exchange factor GrpE [Microcoleaceae cyanobacterium]